MAAAMRALLRRLANGIQRIVVRRQEQSPVERLIVLILLNAKKSGTERIVIEFRPDGDSTSWPPERPPPDEEPSVEWDGRFEDEDEDLEQQPAPGVCGVHYYRQSESFTEMYPPVLLWPAIRDELLLWAGIDSEQCQRYRNGYRYHGQSVEKIEGAFHLDSDGQPLADYAVAYEVDYDAERVVLDVST